MTEIIHGIVDRVAYHNPDTGWSVLKVSSVDDDGKQEAVIVHQMKVFAGATMAFKGTRSVHPRFGHQFKAFEAIEQSPATCKALEKYLGSGFITGIGPKTARKIVSFFGQKTLAVFENTPERLLEVPGVGKAKLKAVHAAWDAHKRTREVMLFLQSHGISPLYAIRIFKAYGDQTIPKVTENPYCLARDFHGIGFYSADQVALSLGFAPQSRFRVTAGIEHVLAEARGSGHCYLKDNQIAEQVNALIGIDVSEHITPALNAMRASGRVMVRALTDDENSENQCYYTHAAYWDETYVAEKVGRMQGMTRHYDSVRAAKWLQLYCKAMQLQLSTEQEQALLGIIGSQLSILTGGPGCGKTTTLRVLVQFFASTDQRILLAAPTGRAAQRMGEVIGWPAKTIHRLLEWQEGRFKKNEKDLLDVDCLLVDESSMLDIHLAASLLKAVPETCQVVFIGDADQLPSVGAGNVLKDMIQSKVVPCFRLTKVFRQARFSKIIAHAHQINRGQLPHIASPFHQPQLWRARTDCLFIDSEEATKEQLQFVHKVKSHFKRFPSSHAASEGALENLYAFEANAHVQPCAHPFTIPRKFLHVDLEEVLRADNQVEALRAVIQKIHPWSSLYYGRSATDVVRELYLDWIPKYYGREREIQVLSPMTRGSLGTHQLNRMLQTSFNPHQSGKREMTSGSRVFREGDRVIHLKNNYDLGVFNGDIGVIRGIDHQSVTLRVTLSPDNREVVYQQSDIAELDLAYAITIHKSQGSEFEIVILPVFTQHYKMLYRNLIYTGLTRAKKLAVLVGTRRALAMAVHNQKSENRQTGLQMLLKKKSGE